MKVIIVLLSLVVTLSAHANMQYKVEDGKLLSTPSLWSDTGVKVTPEAEKYPKEVIAARSHPGVLVETEKRDVFSDPKMTGLFHQQLSMTTTGVAVMYQPEKAIIDTVSKETVELHEAMFNPYLILWLISVGLMAVGVRLKRSALVFIASVISVLVVMCATHSLAILVTTFACMFAFLTLFVMITRPKAEYIFFSRVFYFLMCVSAAITYYPLFT